MFNGLIKSISTVKSFSQNILSLRSNLVPEIGDSIACNGICLSVISIQNDGFSLNVSSETQKIVVPFRAGQKIHTEPALRLGDKIDGHLLGGHIDGLGKITKITKLASGVDFFIKLDECLLPYVCKKGSIAVNGVSLTINEVINDEIRLTIIDITLKDTLFCEYKIGDYLNIETDMLARYAKRILQYKKDSNSLTQSEIDRISYLY